MKEKKRRKSRFSLKSFSAASSTKKRLVARQTTADKAELQEIDFISFHPFSFPPCGVESNGDFPEIIKTSKNTMLGLKELNRKIRSMEDGDKQAKSKEMGLKFSHRPHSTPVCSDTKHARQHSDELDLYLAGRMELLNCP